MASTPLIHPFQSSAGTFYGFSSAVNHISTVVNSSQYRVRFSKYALLQIPESAFQSTSDKINRLYPELLLGRREVSTAVETYLDNNQLDEIPASFQNFALNFETLLLNQGGYDNNPELESIAERVFFKWLIETGAIRFRIAETESTLTDPVNNQDDRRYLEEPTSNGSSRAYQPVIRQVGDINILNTIQDGGQSFSEIYVHTPSKHGNTPFVLLKSEQDNNYTAGLEISAGSYIEGQSSEFISSTPLPLTPFYNKDDVGNKEYQTSTSSDYNRWDANQSGLVPAATMTQNISAGTLGYSYDVLKSVVDGISIDFNEDSYQDIQDNNYDSIGEFNEDDLADNFKFNAILVYYDVLENVGTTEEVWEKKSTNLYGVQFVTPPYLEGNGSATKIKIPELWKFKTIDGNSPGNSSNGNSYGFRLNIGFDTDSNQVTETKVVNDYNTFSLNLFNDALNNLTQATDYLGDAMTKIANFEQRLSDIEDIITTSGSSSNQTLNSRVTKLEQINAIDSPIHEQTTPSDTWVFTHNLGMYPPVTVVDDNGNKIYAGVKYISDSKIEVSFDSPETGKIYLGVIQITN